MGEHDHETGILRFGVWFLGVLRVFDGKGGAGEWSGSGRGRSHDEYGREGVCLEVIRKERLEGSVLARSRVRLCASGERSGVAGRGSRFDEAKESLSVRENGQDEGRQLKK